MYCFAYLKVGLMNGDYLGTDIVDGETDRVSGRELERGRKKERRRERERQRNREKEKGRVSAALRILMM